MLVSQDTGAVCVSTPLAGFNIRADQRKQQRLTF